MLIHKIISKVEDPINSLMTFPLDAPIPNKGDEIIFNGIYGIVEIISYIFAKNATEIHIKVKSHYINED